MAGVSTKDIKNRIRSMENTKQITKAMEMVAASKLRHAQSRLLASRPYFEILRNTIVEIANFNRDFSSPYLRTREVKRTLFVVIAGDRGLAGGYNSNILKLCMQEMQAESASVLPIGKKALDYFASRKYDIFTDAYSEADDVRISDCFTLAKSVSKAFLSGACDEVYLIYTRFNSALSQSPKAIRILPLEPEAEDLEDTVRMDTVYEPNAEEAFAAIVPEYLGGMIYGAVCESRCSEQAARRAAMDSATQNAEDMIADLNLKYNRARQAAITQEITEIVAGSDA